MGRLPDGRAVFVPLALPGETIRITLTEEKRGFARGEIVEILRPAANRIEPRCRHFGSCGGCHYQHLSYADQLTAKTEILIDQLERIGKLSNPPIRAIVPSPNIWNYRNHVQFHQDPQGRLGFLALRSDQFAPVEECHLPEESINAIWPQLEIDPLEDLERIGLRAGSDGEHMLVLESGTDIPFDFMVDFPIAAVQSGPEEIFILSGSHYFEISVKDRPFRVSAESFFQVNTAMAEKMVDELLENLRLDLDTTLLDIYCGVGLFSAFLAPKVARLIGIESNSAAVADFTENLDEFDHVEIYEAAAEDVFLSVPLEADVVVVDPPRSGLAISVLEAIIKLDPRQLAYISCDPATLARDARRLTENGYRITQITPFDLFPQTYHIESISFWEK